MLKSLPTGINIHYAKKKKKKYHCLATLGQMFLIFKTRIEIPLLRDRPRQPENQGGTSCLSPVSS